VKTPLARQLAAGADPPKATALDAFLLARRLFVAGERIDMTAIAEELGVNRVTLYRWVGSREQLLVEVIWSLAKRAIEIHTSAAGRRKGGPWIADVFARFVDGCVADPAVRQFVVNEGEFAMRLLTRGDGGFQPRMIELIRSYLDEEVTAGRLTTRVPLEDLAYTLVRIGESFVYLDLITGEEPQAGRAEPVLRALLR
jgi:AcrR family transcriptional regulator